MTILSLQFCAFTAIALLIYWSCPAKARWGVLLATSAVFAWFANNGSLSACLLLVAMPAGAWLAGLLFSKSKGQGRKTILIITIVFEIGLLIYLKDITFFYNLFGYQGDGLNTGFLIAPLGISYFVLSSTSYVLDVYWEQYPPEKNPLRVILFGIYFPLLTSGPIVRYQQTGLELFKAHKWCYDNFCFGLQRILWGLFKKLVISERLTVLVNAVYSDPVRFHGLFVWIAVLCFVGQLYTDFSGCIDIVLGVSQLFGIELPENFDLPFSAKNLSEFWRRWHMTLGLWVKNYILYPLLKSNGLQNLGKLSKRKFGKRIGKNIPVWIGLFCTWFSVGFWHGGTWNYIIGSGLWFWFLIVLGELFAPVFQKLLDKLAVRTDSFSWRFFQSVRTTILYSLGLGIFRAASLREGLSLYRAGLSLYIDRSFLNMGLGLGDYQILLVSFLILSTAGVVRLYTGIPLREWMAKQCLVFRWTVWIALFAFVLIFGKYGSGYVASDFIYRGF